MIDNNNAYYYVFPGYDHVFQSLLLDLEKHDNCEMVPDILGNETLCKFWKMVNRHPKVARKVNGIMSSFFGPFIKEYHKENKQNIYVFSNIAIQYVSIRRLSEMKARGDKIVLYFLDDSSNYNSRIAFDKIGKIEFDLVCTFDKGDAQKYNFEHFYSMYSRIDGDAKEIKYDAVFVGSDKGRFSLIEQIFNKIDKGGNLFFSVFQASDKCVSEYEEKMVVNQSIEYYDVVEKVKESNCIIDIVIGEQTGLSLRAYEAIAYNKKLITNNEAIRTFPFYDSRYMKIFREPVEIDPQFVFEREQVEYGYMDEYSPWNFLVKISELIQ